MYVWRGLAPAYLWLPLEEFHFREAASHRQLKGASQVSDFCRVSLDLLKIHRLLYHYYTVLPHTDMICCILVLTNKLFLLIINVLFCHNEI